MKTVDQVAALDTALMNAAIILRRQNNMQLATAIEDARRKLAPVSATQVDRMMKALTVVVLNSKHVSEDKVMVCVSIAWLEAVTQLIMEAHQPPARVISEAH